jgi:predicted permease
MLVRLALGLGLFLGSMGIGWWLNRAGWLDQRRASAVIRWTVVTVSPVTLTLSFWSMDLRSREPWLLPFLGCLVSCAALLPAFLYIRWARMGPAQAGIFLNAAFFSNLGFMGAFSVFALFGEQGYALAVLYYTYFSPAYYTLGFAIAARGGPAAGSGRAPGPESSELRLYPFIGMVVGGLLSWFRVPRPEPLGWLNAVLIPVTTALSLITIGSQLTFESPRGWWRPCLMMSAIKFLYSPAVALALCAAFGITGLTRQVVLIEAGTPVGVSTLALPLLFGLDRKLGNALWLFTTALAVPIFVLVLPLLASLR